MKVSISDEVFEVTDEQLVKIKAIVEKKFEPIEIHEGCFVVSVNKHYVKIVIGDDYSSGGCSQTIGIARQFIAAIESAIKYIEN